MSIPGKRITRTRLIQSEKYVVAVEVEMVIPDDDPSEPCYESETVQFLKEEMTGLRTGKANPASFVAALEMAWEMAERQVRS